MQSSEPLNAVVTEAAAYKPEHVFVCVFLCTCIFTSSCGTVQIFN